MREIIIGGTYKHFKGGLYKVTGTARNSENTKEEFVIYKHLDGEPEYGLDQLYIRSLIMFLEEITRDGKTFCRFEEVKEVK